ncbi:hypothetical protein [Kordia jejudonensis]|uniref:hypothetical protein n=1 Tax=Kordia jejudonensis TaxID=1348245 RepID=UPI0006296142|nr:hypothetical protein [Kordia jejudonensis]
MDLTQIQQYINEKVDAIVTKIVSNIDNDAFYHKGTFNTKDLPDHEGYTVFANSDDTFRENSTLYDPLDKLENHHCMYIFELDSAEAAQQLNMEIKKYRSLKGTINNYKTVPPTNSYNGDGKYFYIGIRRGFQRTKTGVTNIVSRMNQHLGYYHHPHTQGLQLYEYAKGKDFNITLKVIAFEGIEPYLLNIIEKKVAQILRPLCGRH